MEEGTHQLNNSNVWENIDHYDTLFKAVTDERVQKYPPIPLQPFLDMSRKTPSEAFVGYIAWH